MKLLTTLLIASLAALGVYAARRRIVFALRTGAIVYIIVLFGRLVFALDRLEDLVWPVIGMLVVWAVAWFVSNLYFERKRRQKFGR